MFRALGNTPFTWVAAVIAKYSYGIYLSHILVLNFAFRTLALQSGLVRWSVFIVLAGAVPFLVYHLLEAPMIRVGRKWPRLGRRSQQPEPVGEVQLAR
jgi:peptidoglycan/LPS O-acetylase OafA/YrhL